MTGICQVSSPPRAACAVFSWPTCIHIEQHTVDVVAVAAVAAVAAVSSPPAFACEEHFMNMAQDIPSRALALGRAGMPLFCRCTFPSVIAYRSSPIAHRPSLTDIWKWLARSGPTSRNGRWAVWGWKPTNTTPIHTTIATTTPRQLIS